jgi:hypothetical protein
MSPTSPYPEALASFLESVKDIQWLQHAEEPFESGVVVADVVEGWDGWNEKMLEVWLPRTKALENAARSEIGDEGIDLIFGLVSERLTPGLSKGLSDYFDRRPATTENKKAGVDVGLYQELQDAVTRDLCWAAIEAVLNRRDFFSELIGYYRAGRWPCAWDGEYPEGRVVVL